MVRGRIVTNSPEAVVGDRLGDTWGDDVPTTQPDDVPTTRPGPADLAAVPEDERFLAGLELLLGGLDQAGHGELGERVMRFLRTGSGPEVLHDWWGMNTVRAVISPVGDVEPFDVYAWFDAAPPVVAFRWVAVVSAHSSSWETTLLGLPAGAEWLGALIAHVETVTSRGPVTAPSHATVEQLLAAVSLPPTTLLQALFTSPAQSGGYGIQQSLTSARWPGFSAAVHRHGDTVRAWLPPTARPAGPGVQARTVRLLELLDDATLAGFAGEVAEFAVSGHRDVRAACAVLVDRCPAAVSRLELLARDGKPAQRAGSLRQLLGRANDPATAVRLRGWAASDRSAVVRAVADEHGPPAVHDLPRLPDVGWAAGITPEVEVWARSFIEEINAERDRWHRAYPGAYGPQGPPQLGADHLAVLLAALASEDPGPLAAPFAGDPGTGRDISRTVFAVIRSLGLGPVELPGAVKVLLVTGCPLEESREPNYWDDIHRPEPSLLLRTVISGSRNTPGIPRMLHAAAVAVALGLPPSLPLNGWCGHFHSRLGWDWPAGDLEPYFAWLARTSDVLLDELNRTEGPDWIFDREALFRAAGMIEDKPKDLADLLFTKALGPAKRDRALAQQALAGFPAKESRIAEALCNTQSGVRAQAAAWLGRLRHLPSARALERAAGIEKQDAAKAAMIDALELLGRPVTRYLDRAALADQALTGLARGLPRTLGWERLPEVRWARPAEPVPGDVLRWWMVQTVKLKSSEPGALLRKYCGMLDPADRERLGLEVLRQWISLDDAETAKWSTGARSVAVAAKGVLALAAACCGRDAVPVIEQYVVTHYGNRPHQGRALIGMLPWIDHPSAVQLLLTLRKRFRTASFQEDAARHIETLAQRRGWTVDQLADRTLPDAGFDATGRMLLPYGSRTLSAVLAPDLTIELRGPDDARIAALPAPRAADDEALVAAAKKAVTTARKEIKTLVRQQADRLHEAMCVHREWRFDEWDAQLNRHPVVRRLVQRLVWTVAGDDVPAVAFRPLDDGTLTDASDAPVTPGPASRIRLAHDLLLTRDQGEAWLAHLADYGITPLFAQFGRARYRLPAAQIQDESLDDVHGAGLEAFTLRSQAIKLGYQRSAPVDGAFFDSYEKRFPGAGLIAWLGFSGNELPEENKPVTLTGTRFTGPDGALRLGELPAVLLAECRQDLLDLAGVSDPLAERSTHDEKG